MDPRYYVLSSVSWSDLSSNIDLMVDLLEAFIDLDNFDLDFDLGSLVKSLLESSTADDDSALQMYV